MMSTPNSNNSNPRMPVFYRFFGWCAGAQLDVLKDYPEDQDRYFGIGTMVFMTGAFAFMSSSYALSWVFQSADGSINYPMVAAAGGMWSLFIFLLDRYFVSSMHKSENSWDEWKLALPRLILAALIGIVVSHPFELRLFQSELLQELAVKKRANISSMDSAIGGQINVLKGELALLPSRYYSTEGQGLSRLDSLIQNERIEIEARLKPLRDSVQCECNGACGTGKKGDGPACGFWKKEVARIIKESNAQMQKWESEKVPIQALVDQQKVKEEVLRSQERDNIMKRIGSLEAQRSKTGTDITKEFSNSILAQSQTLSEISSRPGIATMKWFITLLFIMLETAPILVKLLSKEGAYEMAIRRIGRQRIRAARNRALPNPPAAGTDNNSSNETNSFWRNPNPTPRRVDDDDDD